MQARNKKTMVGVLLLGCLLALVGLINEMSKVAETMHPPPPVPATSRVQEYWKDILSVSPAGPRGDPKAQFSLVEFGDFQCPHCGDARPSIEQAVDGSQGRLNMYYVQTPLSIHQWAEPAAEAAVFASKHGKFWPMYDVLYTHQKDLEPGNYSSYGALVGLDGNALRKAVESHQYAAAVDRSNKLADYLGVEMTPLVALRNNRTGEFLWAVQGNDDVQKALQKADWAGATRTAVVAGPPKS